MNKLVYFLSLCGIFIGAHAEDLSKNHVIAPVCRYYHEKIDGKRVHGFSFGAEHRYEGPQGVNTRVHLSSLTPENKLYSRALLEGSYKITVGNAVRFAPLLGVSWEEILTSSADIKGYLRRNGFHGGLGAEKEFSSGITLGASLRISKDLEVRKSFESKRDNLFYGSFHSKDVSYEWTAFCKLDLFKRGVFELAPFYKAAFNGSNSIQGAQLAYLFKF